MGIEVSARPQMPPAIDFTPTGERNPVWPLSAVRNLGEWCDPPAAGAPQSAADPFVSLADLCDRIPASCSHRRARNR